jgi:hypothetical protein
MRDLVILFVHAIAILARLLGPGGIRSVVAESVLARHQLLILNRSRQRSPHPRASDRLVAGLCALLIRPTRLIRSAIVLKPSTLLNLHRAMKNRKYQLLFSPNHRAKTVPYVPISHPFVERLIGTLRRECLDRTLFWTTADLESKLLDFKHFYNSHRAHAGLDGRTPEPSIGQVRSPVSLLSYQWQKHCRGLYQTPIAA